MLKTRSLASIQRVQEICPIEAADRIEVATVLGYKTVIKKGEFNPGDLCVWHEPDTVLPERPEYELLRKQGFRLKVARVKGQVSQGLALPLGVLQPGNYAEGDDVTELTGITKYEKELSKTALGYARGPFPSFIPKTDEPNLKSLPTMLDEFAGRECVITMKVDGSSGTFYLRQGEFGVCSRNLDLLETPESLFWQVARQFKVREALETLDGDFAVQGEVYGEGVQRNAVGIKGVSLALFNLFNISTGCHAGHDELEAFCRNANIPMVETIWRGDFCFDLTELSMLAESQTYGGRRPAEGIVIRPVLETESSFALNRRLSAKMISTTFALKYGE